MERAALAVFVEHFEFPPTEQFVSSFRSILTSNFADHENYVTSGRNLANSLDISHCVRYGMETAERLLKTVPRAAMSASVVPLILEVQSGPSAVHQGLVFVSARNAVGHEWVYAHFVGKIVTPVEVTHMLADSVNAVLEERGSLDPDPSVADLCSITAFIDAIVVSATEVLKKGSAKRMLHS